MNIVWGVILFIVTSVGYFGQLISAHRPKTATRLGLMEAQAEVDPTFFANVRGEAYWDSASLWALLLAGILLVLNHPAWPVLGLVGGGMYLYFAGRGIVVRREMQAQGIPIGNPENLRVNYAFLAIWGITALITLASAVQALAKS